MTENTMTTCDRDDHAAINENVKQAIQALSEIPTEEIASILCIVSKKPTLDEDGEMSTRRMFVNVGTLGETSRNVMEIITKTAEMMEEGK